jgi:hypothetical protein
MNGGVERLGRPRRERLFGRRPWLSRVDDDLLIRLGVGDRVLTLANQKGLHNLL